jgi:acetyl-CoA carboxylase, biotin carboxylase subunit
MFHRVLIANRGEIAVRIIRACHELGIEAVAVYSEADRDSLHVKLADEAVCIGPPPAKNSYLHMHHILAAAQTHKADAIHPGFGFLSENSEFARICEDMNIKFIGPSADAIGKLGQKAIAKQIMDKEGVPIIPGPEDTFIDAEAAYEAAKEIGFPVVIKAVSGGGGRGIRVIFDEKDFIQSFQVASHEADAAFKDPSLYIEKFFENPKHIEFQILGDEHGSCIHLGERDCSSQRRKQKVIEETPSPVITGKQRDEMGKKLTKALSNIGYYNAGTVEFLYENGQFYFMEMNTRIQVEHPVTEASTGVDLIRQQILIAAGEKLEYKQSGIKLQRAAIECRINAEDPDRNFMPFAGTIEQLILPGGPGIRIDSGLYTGCTIPPFYDSMIAKVIAVENTRDLAISRMIRALGELEIQGVKHNRDFLMRILTHEEFIKGTYTINFIEKRLLKS